MDERKDEEGAQSPPTVDTTAVAPAVGFENEAYEALMDAFLSPPLPQDYREWLAVVQGVMSCPGCGGREWAIVKEQPKYTVAKCINCPTSGLLDPLDRIEGGLVLRRKKDE